MCLHKSGVRIRPMANSCYSSNQLVSNFKHICVTNFLLRAHTYLMASSFIASEWIGLEKEYDIIKIPEYVSEAKKQPLKMPDAVEATIPHNTMPLRDFLACKLPAWLFNSMNQFFAQSNLARWLFEIDLIDCPSKPRNMVWWPRRSSWLCYRKSHFNPNWIVPYILHWTDCLFCWKKQQKISKNKVQRIWS